LLAGAPAQEETIKNDPGFAAGEMKGKAVTFGYGPAPVNGGSCFSARLQADGAKPLFLAFLRTGVGRRDKAASTL
jgi:hypothetical protein